MHRYCCMPHQMIHEQLHQAEIRLDFRYKLYCLKVRLISRNLIIMIRVKYTDGLCSLSKFWIWSLAFQKYTDGPYGLSRFWIWSLAFQKYTDGPCGLHFVSYKVQTTGTIRVL
ncbi:hypothetical protein Hanom_Chr07g00671451 [Helianthus anomalus]